MSLKGSAKRRLNFCERFKILLTVDLKKTGRLRFLQVKDNEFG